MTGPAALRLPLIAAPMTGVSTPALVVAACRAGVIGAFPTHNCESPDELDRWLREIRTGLDQSNGMEAVAANLVVHRTNARLADDLDCLVEHGVRLVITSVGSPEPVVDRLHRAGCRVFSDVASLRHAERALASGADGLVLLTAGSGGQTGWANPFAFTRAVRDRFDGPIVLAGGISDGAALWAAQALGCDFGYMGTRFIATVESAASADYRRAVVAAELDQITETTEVTGLPLNVIAGTARSADGGDANGFRLEHVTAADCWAAGHSVSGAKEITTVSRLVEQVAAEYEAARHRSSSHPRAVA